MADLACIDLGSAPYEPTMDLQRRLVRRVQSARHELAYLVLVEHDPPIITLGASARRENIVASAEQLSQAGIELRQTRRGGDVSYHGPGQIVGYPVLRLDLHGRDLHRYLRDLEEVVIRALARLGVQASRSGTLTGVWIGPAKVAAVGVAVSRWVTYHGFALNVCPNMDHFRLIVPCGLAGRPVTSLAAELGRPVATTDVKPFIMQSLVDIFGFAGSCAIVPEAVQ